jgi:HrpA-like RNA helicase
VSRLEELEHRARRRDIVVDDQVVFDLYDARIPADVVSAAHFDRWWRAGDPAISCRMTMATPTTKRATPTQARRMSAIANTWPGSALLRLG